MSLRCIIVAIVSSAPQADDDKTSLPLQIARARAEIQRNGWREVAAPVALAQSRDYYNAEDLCADSPDYAKLLQLAEQGAFDVVVGRDHARVLGRTEALQTELRTYLQLCRVQTYFYMAPIMPVPPTQLGARGRGQISLRYMDAIAAVRDEEEVARLVQRYRDGMTGHAIAGRFRRSRVPFAYTREILGYKDERAIYGELVVIPEQKERILTILRAYRDGESLITIRQTRLPSYTRTQLYKWLTYPYYVGVLVHGMSREDMIIANGKTERVRVRIITPARAADLAEAFLDGADARTAHEIENGVIVSSGQWAPLLDTPDDLQLWRDAQAERRRRSAQYGKQAALSSKGERATRLFGGIAYCGYCNGPLVQVRVLYTVPSHRHRQVQNDYSLRTLWYGCGNNYYKRHRRTYRADCPHKNEISHADLAQQLFGLLSALVRDKSQIAALIPVKSNEGRFAQIDTAITAAQAAIRRWDAAYEDGTIDHAKYKEKIKPHTTALRSLQSDRASLVARHVPTRSVEEVAQHIRDILQSLSEATEDPNQVIDGLKARLRHIISAIAVEGGAITYIELRP